MNLDRTKLALAVVFLIAMSSGASATDETKIRTISDAAIKPIMDKNGIPGMAVAISVNGKITFSTMVSCRKRLGKPVSPTTMFELGSISKTLTVTLTSYAEAKGQLSLSDKVDKYLPSMKGSRSVMSN